MQDDLNNEGNNPYFIREGIRGVAAIMGKYEKEIPVYGSDVQLGDLANVQPLYVLMGDVWRRGDLFITLKDDSMFPLWGKDDLVLLQDMRDKAPIIGEKYYFLLKDGREIAGSLTAQGIITCGNKEDEQVQPDAVIKTYKIMLGLKKEDALNERQKDALNEQEEDALKEQEKDAFNERQKSALKKQEEDAPKEQKKDALKEQEEDAPKEQKEDALNERQKNA